MRSKALFAVSAAALFVTTTMTSCSITDSDEAEETFKQELQNAYEIGFYTAQNDYMRDLKDRQERSSTFYGAAVHYLRDRNLPEEDRHAIVIRNFVAAVGVFLKDWHLADAGEYGHVRDSLAAVHEARKEEAKRLGADTVFSLPYSAKDWVPLGYHRMGYDSTLNMGWLQEITDGPAYQNLIISKDGSLVEIKGDGNNVLINKPNTHEGTTDHRP